MLTKSETRCIVFGVDKNINKKKGSEKMVDTELLDEWIVASGKKIGYLAKKIGVSRQYFNMKRNNKADFTNRETDILCSELGITSLMEKEKIFFAKNVDKNANKKGGQ